MSKRQFCMLAVDADQTRSSLFQMRSEKLDGQRAIWDGGASIGLPKSEVPYTNLRSRPEQKCTGLFSRYGNVVAAPANLIAALPRGIILDMELWAGHGMFEFVESVVRKIVPVPAEWEAIRFMILDAVPPSVWLAPGEINERNCKIDIFSTALPWWRARSTGMELKADVSFERRYTWLAKRNWSRPYYLHEQVKVVDHQESLDYYAQVLSEGAEGMMLKSPASLYQCSRVPALQKWKPVTDAVGTVVGWTWGRLPDNSRSVGGEATGNTLGMLGCLNIVWEGRALDISGFTLPERQMLYVKNSTCAADEGYFHAGEPCDPNIVYSELFPLGSTVEFKYTGLTASGLPRSARFKRCIKGI